MSAAKEDAALKDKAFDDISAALKNGELVGIFPEGEISRHPDMNPFKPGVEQILARDPVVGIPTALRGLWGSFFSRKDGEAMQKIPRRFLSKIEYVCGQSLAPESASVASLEEKVRALRGDWL